MGGKLLVADFRIPAPDQDSGSASTFAYLRILTSAGYKLTFIPLRMNGAPGYAATLNHMGIETPGPPEWPSLEAAVEAFAPGCDAALLYRGPVAGRVFDIIRKVSPSTHIVFHPVDLHFLRMERQAALAEDAALVQAAAEMRALELSLFRRADAAIVVSASEQKLLQELLPDVTTNLIPILRAVPPERATPGFANRRDIVFVGAFLHQPNVDGIMWFVREVWPRLKALGYSGRLVIAGAFVSEDIEALAGEDIVIRGHVPDLMTFLDGFRLCIAPLRYGAGIKGKIVSSLSLGLPAVVTAIAAEGMGLRHGFDALIAETADEMAQRITELYGDGSLWRTLAATGYQTFLERFSESAGESKLLLVFDRLLSNSRLDTSPSPRSTA